jgi:hypothetical protein
VKRKRKTGAALLKRQSGILLDISLGGKPQSHSVTLKELRHHPLRLPWSRLPDACVHTAVVVHVLEYLKPEQFFDWFDELWRVVRPGGIVSLSGPYGGDESTGWLSDPEHRLRIVEPTFAWLDPRTPVYSLQESERGRKAPKPWNMLASSRVPGTLGTVSYNVQLLRAKQVTR